MPCRRIGKFGNAVVSATLGGRMAATDALADVIHPVILSGGEGSRLWPLSQAAHPKQFLSFSSSESLLQQTALRVADPDSFAPPIIVCCQIHRFLVAEQLSAIGSNWRAIVVEPHGRNTAPAITAAALILADENPDSLMLVLPSDHIIGDVPEFHRAIAAGRVAAKTGQLVTFGMTAESAHTGYGYLKAGTAIEGAPGCYKLERFVEKPPSEMAETLIAEGNWAWNSGIFLFSAKTLLQEMARYEPDLLTACKSAVDTGRSDIDFFRLSEDAFAAAPACSLDNAVMERTTRAAVVPASIGWSDLGSWPALWEHLGQDADGNVITGPVLARDTSNSYLHSDGRLIATVGLDGFAVVATDDAVLVCPMQQAQEVKALVGLAKKVVKRGST